MLTGSVLQTTPKRETTLGCENWAMMAASWRNFTLSSSDDPSFRSFSATGMLMTPFFHKPCSTEPNCPDPRCLCTLRINSHNRDSFWWSNCAMQESLTEWNWLGYFWYRKPLFEHRVHSPPSQVQGTPSRFHGICLLVCSTFISTRRIVKAGWG